MRENADGIVDRIVSVDGAAAEIIVVAGLKAVGSGHFQRLVQHLAAGRSERLGGAVRIIVAGAADAANIRNILDKFFAMGFGPFSNVSAECFPIHD